jgi:hypothetical protein
LRPWCCLDQGKETEKEYAAGNRGVAPVRLFESLPARDYRSQLRLGAKPTGVYGVTSVDARAKIENVFGGYVLQLRYFKQVVDLVPGKESGSSPVIAIFAACWSW